MTWPTSQIAETSAAQVWARICGDALNSKRNVIAVILLAEAGALTPKHLRQFIPQFKGARAYLAANDGVAGLQVYARLVSSDVVFDLSVESAALKAAYAAVIQEGRALHNASIGGLAADGTVTEPLETIPAASCAALVASCQAFAAAVS